MVALLVASTPCSSAAARGTAEAMTPYMGVDTWYAYGPNIDETTVVDLVNATVSRGLKAAGYRYVWLDAGWWHGARDGNGDIVVDRTQWPHGMAWLASYIHAKGLRAGIYTDAGTTGCSNGGSYGHYQADVDTFAAWGFDALKVDYCGGRSMHLDARASYSAVAQAILHDRPHRKILFEISNGVVPNEYGRGNPPYADSAYASYLFGPSIANSWRTGPDVGTPGAVGFLQVLRNLELDAKHPKVAGRGHWNDPDYIVPDEGMTPAQARAQFTMWAIVAAPLMVSEDVSTMPARTVAMLTNRNAISISQDPLGIQGRMVVREGLAEVWVKPLAGGERAVAFLNLGPAQARAFATAAMIGLRHARAFEVRDVWRHRTSSAGPRIRVEVPAEGAVLLRVALERR